MLTDVDNEETSPTKVGPSDLDSQVSPSKSGKKKKAKKKKTGGK